MSDLENRTSQGSEIPPELEVIRERARAAMQKVEPAGPPRSSEESRGLWLSSRTAAGREIPDYYLVYFLLVDLLGYPNLGKGEKVAWIVPVRYHGRLYSIEHRKFGLGIFAPTLDVTANSNAPPTEQAEADAQAIVSAIKRAVSIAEPYFEWRAAQAASTSELNVVNTSRYLFERYEYFRDRYNALSEEADRKKDEWNRETTTLPDGSVMTRTSNPSYALRAEAIWNAQAAIEAFFSWTEHSFIHLAALQGRLRTGDEVALLAAADWKSKFKAALDLSDLETKQHYEKLLDLRAQFRNFMAHGAFGKRGEAFSFHSGAGAVPVLLTRDSEHRYSLTGASAVKESLAMQEIEAFIDYLWSGSRSPAKAYLFSGLPLILSLVPSGVYARAMSSDDAMASFIRAMRHEFDQSANMDW